MTSSIIAYINECDTDATQKDGKIKGRRPTETDISGSVKEIMTTISVIESKEQDIAPKLY